MRTCKCPGCGAELNIEETNRDFAFCQYCGAKIMLDDYSSVHRIIDEARLKEAEIKMRQLDMEEKKQSLLKAEHQKEEENERKEQEEKKQFRMISVISILVAIVLIITGSILFLRSIDSGLGSWMTGLFISLIGWCIIIFFSLISKGRKDAENARNGMIKLTFSVNQEENYQVVKANYEKIGFKNIIIVNLQDLFFGVLEKPGKVESISIDGFSPIYGKWYNPNAQVIIKYHGFANKKG